MIQKHETGQYIQKYIRRHGIKKELPDPDPTTKLSVVIPALNEQELLPRTLESFRRQTNSHFEVVVVDNGSSDDTPNIVKELSPQVDYPLYLLKEPQRGCGHARKKGMDQSPVRKRIDLIAGIDADTQVPQSWVESVYREAQNGADLFTGEIKNFEPHEVPHDALNVVDRVRRTLSEHVLPKLRGAHFVISTPAYVAVDGIEQPYSDKGVPIEGEEETLMRPFLDKGGHVSYFPVDVYTHPRRVIKNILDGHQGAHTLYSNEGVSQIRDTGDLEKSLRLIPPEYYVLYLERSLKNLFRKNIMTAYNERPYRRRYWPTIKALFDQYPGNIEEDMEKHHNNVDFLWNKYGDTFLDIVTGLDVADEQSA